MRTSSTKPEPPQTWAERLSALRNLLPLFKMVWETSRSLTLCSFFLRCIIAFAPVANLLIFRQILNAVVQAVRSQDFDKRHLWMLLALSLVVSLVSGGLSRLMALCDSLLGDRVTHELGLNIMQHAASLDLACFEDPVFYDKLDRARRHSSSRLGMLTSVANAARQFLTLLSMICVVGLFSPWLLLLLVLATLPALINETQFAVLTYSMLFRRTPERRQLDYVRFLGSSSHSAKEVRIFGLSEHLAGRLGRLFERLYQENKRLAVRRTVYSAVINLVSSASNYGAYAFILFRALSRAVSVGDLGLGAGAFFRAGSILEGLVGRLADASEQALNVKDLFDFLDTKPAIASHTSAVSVPRPIRQGFEFENVSFTYPNSDTPVLKNLSFQVFPGQRIALVGENGAGKTTLVKLLARLYDPTKGRILLDGRDLRDYRVEDLREQFGMIFQDYVKYDMPVSDNIGFGRIEELDDRTRIEAAAKKGSAAEMIETFPDRYDQMLGRRFEGGVDLSTGQWQKIALARAHMRDGQVLILDEPTASLDARAEYEVYRRFVNVTGGRIIILISHRFSTVRMADRIVVLAQGQIVEQGSHQELVSHGGKYAELFHAQAAGYR